MADKYDKIFYGYQFDKPKEATALADMKLRASPEDPEKNFPPSAKVSKKVKAGSTIAYDKVAIVGDVNSPPEVVRGVWYHTADGWVLGYVQKPANTGKVNQYVVDNPEGLAKWQAMQKKQPQPGPGNSVVSPDPPFTEDSPDGAGGLPIVPIVAGVAAAGVLFYVMSRKKG